MTQQQQSLTQSRSLQKIVTLLEETAKCSSPDRRNKLVRTFQTAFEDFQAHGVVVEESRSLQRPEIQNSSIESIWKSHSAGKLLSVEQLTELIAAMSAKGRVISNYETA